MSTTDPLPGAYLAPCRDDAEPCEARHAKGCLCTRERGHAGDHAAHDGQDRMVVRWPAGDLDELATFDHEAASSAARLLENPSRGVVRAVIQTDPHPNQFRYQSKLDLHKALADARSEVERLTLAHLAADQARVAAELRAEGLAEGLRESRRTSHADIARAREAAKDGCGLCRELALHLARCHATLTFPTEPGLDSLRDLVRAVADDRRGYHEAAGEHAAYGDSSAEIYGALDAVLAAYPFLDPGAEPAGEVGDGD